MSGVYASSEPATSGRLVLESSHGPIEVELFAKECPIACRVFVQLCMDGYFDKIPFHRCLPKLLIQAGSGEFREGGTAGNVQKYLERVVSTASEGSSSMSSRSEVHKRIRFNHRGQVAVAQPLDEEGDEGSSRHLMGQFFITLDEAGFLNDKHVIFGSVTGPTIFNALRIGDQGEHQEDNHDPHSMPRITGIKLHSHPFTDMTPTQDVPWRNNDQHLDADAKSFKRRKKNRKATKDVNVLSFGNDDEQVDDDAQHGISASFTPLYSSKKNKHKQKTKHQHDKNQNSQIHADNSNDDHPAAKHSPPSGDSQPTSPTPPATTSPNQDHAPKQTTELMTFAQKMQHQMLSKRQRLKPTSTLETQSCNKSKSSPDKLTNNPDTPEAPSPNHEDQKNSIKEDAPIVSEVEARRARYLHLQRQRPQTKSKKRENKSSRDEDTMQKLMAFKNKVLQAKQHNHGSKEDTSQAHKSKRHKRSSSQDSYHGQVMDLDSSDDDNDYSSRKRSSNWMDTKFQCKRHSDDLFTTDDYVVLDSKGDSTSERAGGRRRHGDASRGRRHDERQHGSRDDRKRGSHHGRKK